MSADPQALIIQAVQALEACTASVRALEKSVDQMRRDLQDHRLVEEPLLQKLESESRAIHVELQRREDREDVTRQADTQRENLRWSTAANLVRSVWGTAEVRLLIVIAVAGWLGVRMDLIQVLAPVGSTP